MVSSAVHCSEAKKTLFLLQILESKQSNMSSQKGNLSAQSQTVITLTKAVFHLDELRPGIAQAGSLERLSGTLNGTETLLILVVAPGK